MTSIRYMAGDQILTTKLGGTLQEITAKGTQSHDEGPTDATHQGLVYTGGSRAMMMEALQRRGLVTAPIEETIKRISDGGYLYRVWRIPMTDKQRRAVTREARRMLEKPPKYGTLELLAQGIDHWIARLFRMERAPIITRRLADLIPGTMICSTSANRPLVVAGVLPHEALYWAPDGIDDWCRDNGGEIVTTNKQGRWRA